MNLRRLTNVGWTPWHLVAALVMAAAGAFATRAAWRDIFFIALNDEEASHIFLVPIVAAWMVWVRRIRIRNCPPEGQFIGPLIVACGWLASVYGYNHAVQSLWHAGAIMVVVGCVLSVLG